MKYLYLFLSIFILTISTSFADGHNIKKDGFLSKKFKVTKLSTIEDPTNKIILINNHGQSNFDGKQNFCTSIDQIRNRVSLIDEEINGKKIMLIICVLIKLQVIWEKNGGFQKNHTKANQS